MKESAKRILERIKSYLSRLSFRTGVIVFLSCFMFYALSFIALALPIGVGMRGVLWTIFFGLAKTTQYTGLAILGAEGVKRLKKMFRREFGKEE